MKKHLWGLSLLIVNAACDSGQQVIAVFADQGERVAVYELEWKSAAVCVAYEACPVESSDWSAKVRLGHLDGDEVALDETLDVEPVRLFWAFGSLAFVDSQGYVMMVDDAGKRTLFHDLGTSETLEIAHLGAYDVAFPSKDGATVAIVSDVESGHHVRFVDPKTARVLAEAALPVRSVLGTGQEPGRARFVWTDEGFGVWGAYLPDAPRARVELQAWLVRSDGSFERRDDLPCEAASPSRPFDGEWALPDGDPVDGPIVRVPNDAPACSVSPDHPAEL